MCDIGCVDGLGRFPLVTRDSSISSLRSCPMIADLSDTRRKHFGHRLYSFFRCVVYFSVRSSAWLRLWYVHSFADDSGIVCRASLQMITPRACVCLGSTLRIVTRLVAPRPSFWLRARSVRRRRCFINSECRGLVWSLVSDGCVGTISWFSVT